MSAPFDLDSLRFDRLLRTSHSEAFVVSQGEESIGRVDLHYGTSLVHALFVVEADLDEETLKQVIDRLDEQIVWTADTPREDFLVTVYRGSEVATFTDTPSAEEVEDE
jgi:hypothetical protein